MTDAVLTTPTSRAMRDATVAVYQETRVGSREFRLHAWLAADQIVERAGGVGEARLHFVLSSQDTVKSEDCLRLAGDRRIGIAAYSAGGWRWMFDGYPRQVVMSWTGVGENRRETVDVIADHVALRMATAIGAMVRGQVFEPIAGATTGPTWIDTLPCIFNPDRHNNCNGTKWEEGACYLFTDPDAAGAVPWTFAKALQFLLQWYGGTWDASVGLVDTSSELGAISENLDRAPPTVTGAARTMNDILILPVPGISVEGQNLLEAIATLCEAAGLRWSITTQGGDNKPENRLRIWAPGTGDTRILRCEPLGTPQANRDAEEIFERNDIGQLRLVADYAAVRNAPLVLGGAKLYEVTVELRPGWPASWDLNPVEGVENQQALYELFSELVNGISGETANEQWHAYHRSGATYGHYGAGGRLWVLNEAGDYSHETYKRGYGPDAFKDDWPAFAFTKNVIGEERTTLYPRRRRFLPLLSKRTAGDAIPVRVEVSVNRDAESPTWIPVAGKVRLLTDQCGLTFNVNSPAEVIAPDPDTPALYDWIYAIIYGKAGVRITATIEGDDRLACQATGKQVDSPVAIDVAQMVSAPEAFAWADSKNTNSLVGEASGVAEVEVDETTQITNFAQRLGAANADPKLTGTVVIPWLDEMYEIGQSITGIYGRGPGFAVRVGGITRYPEVVARIWHLSSSGAGSTTIAIEDLRMMPELR